MTGTAPVRVVLCTAPDQTTARDLATRLVEARLAACVQILPITASVYRWKDEVVAEPEVLLIAKTAADRVSALCAQLPEWHPYEVPEIVVLAAEDGLPAYLAWVLEETRTPA